MVMLAVVPVTVARRAGRHPIIWITPPRFRAVNLASDHNRGAKRFGHVAPHGPPSSPWRRAESNLVFVPDSRGVIHAYDAETGTELWNHSDGTGHQGGIISYAVGGKQYIAITAGFGGMASDDYAPTFGGVYKSMPRDDGALVVYSLK